MERYVLHVNSDNEATIIDAHDDGRPYRAEDIDDVEVVIGLLNKQQATVEALQAQLREGEAAYHNVGEYNDRLKQQVEALQRERDEANLYRDQARANQESLAACVDRDVRKIKDLQAALDAERASGGRGR